VVLGVLLVLLRDEFTIVRNTGFVVPGFAVHVVEQVGHGLLMVQPPLDSC
jgi:hypothetical protein